MEKLPCKAVSFEEIFARIFGVGGVKKLLGKKRFLRGNFSKKFIIINIISAQKSDPSNPWSQTQASLSIPSLHPKKQTKEEKERKKYRRESLPRSDRRGGEKIKQEQKKQKQRPATHIRETNK